MKIQPKLLLRLFFGPLLAISVFTCGGQEETKSSQTGPGQRRGGKGGGAAIPVKAAKVVRSPMNAYVETYARLEAERRIDVRARSTGLVQEIFFEEGDQVEIGQVMVRLDKSELDLRMRQSKTIFAEASINHERTKDLLGKKMISQTEFEAAQLHYENSKIALEEAQLNLAYADIEAPIAGVIALRSVELGDLVGSNQELFTITDLHPLLVRIFIPERRMYQVRKGQQAKIIIEALPERSFSGTISMISPEVDPQSGTVKVTLEVAADGMLKPGMFATVRIITASRPQALVIPKRALVLETDADDVYLIVDDTVRLVPVELGFTEEDRVEVVSGLKEGDLLVTVGHDGLKDGVKVKVIGANGAEPAKDRKPQPPSENKLVMADQHLTKTPVDSTVTKAGKAPAKGTDK